MKRILTALLFCLPLCLLGNTAQFEYLNAAQKEIIPEAEWANFEEALAVLYPAEKRPTLQIEPAAGSLSTSLVYKVTHVVHAIEKTPYIIRLMPDGPYKAKARNKAIEAQTITSDLGIAPTVAYYSKDQHLIATNYVTGRHIKPSELTRPATIKSLAKKIHTLHFGPTPYDPGVTLIHRCQKLLKLLSAHEGAPEAAITLANETLSKIESAFAVLPDPVMSHLDIHPGNIIETPEKDYYLIDWEDAALDERFADLGVFTHLMNLDKKQQEQFLGYYFEGRPVTEVHYAKLHLMEQVSHLRVAAWAYTEALKKDPMDRAFLAELDPQALANEKWLPSGWAFLGNHYTGNAKLSNAKDFQRLGKIFFAEFFKYILSEHFEKDLTLLRNQRVTLE